MYTLVALMYGHFILEVIEYIKEIVIFYSTYVKKLREKSV